jgi:hypothetical protein
MKNVYKIIGIILILLWFGTNLGLYTYIKRTFSTEIEKTSQYSAEKLKLPESPIDSESLSFYRYKLKFPFYKRNIIRIIPVFQHGENSDERFLISMNREYISIWKLAPVMSTDKPFWKKIIFQDLSRFEIIKIMYFSNINNYSWWNRIHNLKLLNGLRLVKSMNLKTAIHKPSHVYDIETPYLKGFLQEQNTDEDQWKFSFTFELGDETYSITYSGLGKEKLNRFKEIISTIRPISDVNKSYKKMEALYKEKGKSRYPEELILMSMISLKGYTTEDLKELLNVMEGKSYDTGITHGIKKQIEYLERKTQPQ